MEKILVTGSDGFFASRFIYYYKDKYNIIGLNHSQLDITDQTAVLNAVKNYSPNYLIHTAAIAETNICEENSDLSHLVNVEGSLNIARACALNGVKLIHLSSEQVYNGNFESGPYSEDCVAIPNTVYGKHKLEAESSIIKIDENAVILRLTWLFGLPEKNKKTSTNIVSNILRTINENKAISIPIYEFRGMTYIYDLLENFSKILELPSGIYNTGSENNLSTYEVAKIIFEELGLENRIGELLIKDDERYKTHYRDLRIDNNKLKDFGIHFPDTGDSIQKGILQSLRV